MSHQRGTILVVEGDLSFNNALTSVLGASNFTTYAFLRAEDALDAGASGVSDCFLIDVQLPGISGFELCTLLRREHPNTPTVFVSAYSEEAHKRAALQIGARAYFSKPFAPRELIQALDCLIESSRRTCVQDCGSQ